MRKKRVITHERPDLMQEWDFDKNTDVTPDSLTIGSTKKVWWKCNTCGFEWRATVGNRAINGTGCPYCAGRAVWKGHNDLTTTQPELADEWNYEKNHDLLPTMVTAGSERKVWWKCAKGHEWAASINSRAAGRGCPYCANKKVLKGYNDLKTEHPELVESWDYLKNKDITPDHIGSGYSKKVWWICEKQHHYRAFIHDRLRGDACPYCSNHKVLSGFNDIQTTFPEIASEWDSEKNKELDIDVTSITGGSNKKVWWKCNTCGNSWRATVNSRCYQGTGCPKCAKAKQTSFPEQALYYYLKKAYQGAVNSYKPNNWKGMEIDVFVPELNLGVEYDGAFWHQDLERDQRKDNLAKDDGMTLLRIREQGALSLEKSKLSATIIPINKYPCPNELDCAITEVFHYIQTNYGGTSIPDINVERDTIDILSLFTTRIEEKSFAITRPELLLEWDYEKNNGINPLSLSEGSNYKVWWVCNKGHSWQNSVARRVRGDSCPYCSSHRVLSGFNDLATRRPDLLRYWDYESNSVNGIDPTIIAHLSNKKVWWKCTKGHKYCQSVSNRVNVKTEACPYCGNRRILKGYNDIAATNPEVALEWDYEKNDRLGLDISEIGIGSKKEAWFRCRKCGHEWKTKISYRKENGCPKCANRAIGKAHRKKVQCIETGVIYESISKAIEALGYGTISNLSRCVNGKSKTAYGFHWKFVDND